MSFRKEKEKLIVFLPKFTIPAPEKSFDNMKIGNIDLGEKPLLLAPMEDVTDASFRFIDRKSTRLNSSHL